MKLELEPFQAIQLFCFGGQSTKLKAHTHFGILKHLFKKKKKSCLFRVPAEVVVGNIFSHNSAV